MTKMNKIKTISVSIGIFACVAMGFSIPVSTSLMGVLVALIVPLWFLSKNYQALLDIIKTNKYLWALLILVGLHFAGLFYGETSIKEVLGDFFNSAELLLIPLMIPFFREEKVRNNAMNLFLLTMTSILFLSYLLWFNLLPESQFIKGTPDDAAVFTSRIKQNILMAFCAFIFAVRARKSTDWENRLLYSGLTILAVFNVTVMVGGKQGYVVLIPLIGYYFINWLRWKGIVLAVLALTVFGLFTYMTPSSRMHQSFKDLFVTMADKESRDWNSKEEKMTSAGVRLSFYKNSMKIIFENPIFGVGTGGFTKAYAEVVKDTKMLRADNPHSEYLRVTSELGLLGLISFLLMLFMQWRLASNLHTEFDKIIATGLVLTILSAALFGGILTTSHKRVFYIWMSALLFGGYKPYHKKNDNGEAIRNKSIG